MDVTTTNFTGYVAVFGRQGNSRSAIRLGRDGVAGSAGNLASLNVGLTPGRHSAQFSRRGGYLWLSLDGKLILRVKDPEPTRVVDRLGTLGGWDGGQVVHAIHVRTLRP